MSPKAYFSILTAWLFLLGAMLYTGDRGWALAWALLTVGLLGFAVGRSYESNLDTPPGRRQG